MSTSRALVSARFNVHEPPAAVDGIIAFAKDVRLLCARTRGVYYDTQFASAPEQETEGRMLYLLLHGTMLWSSGVHMNGPCVVVGSSHLFPGKRGERGETYVITGTPLEVVELRVPIDWLPEGSAERRVYPMSDALWRATTSLVVHACSPAGVSDENLMDVFRILREDGRTTRSEVDSVLPLSPLDHRIWTMFAPVLQNWDFALTLDTLAHNGGRSARQVRRDFRYFASSHPLGWQSFRELSLEYRLRLAILLLSCEAISPTRAAQRAGYSGTTALRRALRDAKLPDFPEIREMLAKNEQAFEAIRA